MVSSCYRSVLSPVIWLALFLSLVHANSGSISSSSSTLPRSSIPRSSRRRILSQPAWNPSLLIDDDGFLKGLYERTPGEWESQVRLRTTGTDLPCRIRQVPGDGNCLFHSVSLSLYHAVNNTHWDLQSNQDALEELYRYSQRLRHQAVQCLRQWPRRLYLQGSDSLQSRELVEAAALQYRMTPDEYCSAMKEDSVWGGGPEIVALSNMLQRPIHVYELAVAQKEKRRQFVLRRMACFGSPRWDRRKALHILSADSRFPDLQPGQQLAAGNHFLAVFIQDDKKRKRLRGGGGRWGLWGYGSNNDDPEDDAAEPSAHVEESDERPKWKNWWSEVTSWLFC